MLLNNRVISQLGICGVVDLLRFGAIALLFIAMFSGKFSFERFLAEESRVEWLQLRLWLTPLAAAIWLIASRAARATDRARPLDKPAVILLAAIMVYHAFLIANTFLLGNPEFARDHLVDIILTLIQIALLAFMMKSHTDVAAFLVIAEATGLLLAFLGLAGFRNPDINGPTLTPFGGPITFYRIEFMAFCAALYGWAASVSHRWRRFHLAAAAITLFAALASLSKAALVGALAVLSLLVLWFIILRRYRDSLVIIAITAVAFTGFSMFRTEMSARVAKLDPGGAQFTYGGKLPHELPHELPRQLQILTKIYSGAYQRFEDLPPEDQHWTRATWEGICNMVPPESVPDYRLKLKEFLEFRTRLALLADNTQRIGMAQQAFAVFKSEPLVGAGIGNYQFLGVNTYKEVMEVARYPHNIVLEHLADGGIIGFLLLATGIAAVIMLAGQALQADGSLVFVAACLAFSIVTSMFSGNYYDFRLFWFVSLLFLRAPWAASMETTASPGRT